MGVESVDSGEGLACLRSPWHSREPHVRGGGLQVLDPPARNVPLKIGVRGGGGGVLSMCWGLLGTLG